MKITDLLLQNFRGYENASFSFGNNPINLFYGPNGIGKSSVLEAIQLVTNPRIFDGREKDSSGFGATDLYLRSMIHDDDYSPQGDHILEKHKKQLLVKASFDNGNTVRLSNNGFTDQLPDVHGGYAFYVDADNSSNLAKFQLLDIQAGDFIDLAEAIYGYECDLDGEVWDERTGEDGVNVRHLFYNDFILRKGRSKVHYAQMCDGEKKIATLLRQLCNPDNVENRNIILIDNIEMHVYYKRHRVMMEKLLAYFQGKQIMATTHSPEMINSVDPAWRYDLEQYRPGYATQGSIPSHPLEEAFDEICEALSDLEGPDWTWGLPRYPKAEYPDWAYATHPVGNLSGHEILIDMDQPERQFDPVKSEYKVGMLRPPGRTKPLPRPEDPRWRTSTKDSTQVAEDAEDVKQKRVFKPLDELKTYVDKLLRKNRTDDKSA